MVILDSTSSSNLTLSLCLVGGDFNFRVNMERSAIVELVNQRNFSGILESDQVRPLFFLSPCLSASKPSPRKQARC